MKPLCNLIHEYIEFKQSMGMRFNSEAVILKAFCKALGNIDIVDAPTCAGSKQLNDYLILH